MTDARREAKIAMLRQHKTIRTLSTETGFSPATIHAALSNAQVSRKVRQTICNSLQIELWGLQPTERYLQIPSSAGVQIEFLNARRARDAVDEFGLDVVTRKGRTISFIKDVTFVAEIQQSQPSASTRKRKISASDLGI
jgi:lambda repressor-like predicted transcriptional regulator